MYEATVPPEHSRDRDQEIAPHTDEELRRESDTILHSFYDSAPMMMGVVDILDNDILHLSDNAATARFMGMTPGMTTRKLASKLGMPEQSIEEWLRHYRECAHTRVPVRFDYPHHTPHEVRWLSVTVSYIATTAEGHARCSYIAEDITAQKRSADLLRQQSEALTESQRWLRSLIDHFPNGAVVLFDPDLRFVVAGGQGLIEAGIPTHFLEGKTVWDAFDPEIAAINDPLMRAALAGSASTAEATYAGRTYELSVLPIRNEEGAITAGMTITQDITVRKQAEAERERLLGQVQAERTRMRTILEQMPAGVFLAEAPSGKLLFANREAERIYNLPDILSISVEDWTRWKAYRLDGSLMLPEDYPLARALTTGATTQDEAYVIERGDGSRTTLLVNAAPIRDAQGVTVAGVVAFYDISDRIKHLQEIEALNARLHRSVQETHHRVKNNLQVISALAELQMEAGDAMVPAAALRRIGQHTRSLAALHDLLTQEAKTSVEADSISTRAALDKLIPLLQSTAGERHIRCQAADFRLPVREGTSLALLVSELVSNAVKHGRTEIELKLTLNGDTVQLEVCDDGPGFPPDFDWRKAANTGLGLIDSTGRHDLHGSLSYENRLEGGARVVVIFPLPKATGGTRKEHS
jgi:PAS domain S-box-containing protein